jgi:hypothetical protein
MRIACVSPAQTAAVLDEPESALEAWTRALDGERLTFEALAADPAHGAGFDVLLVEATPATLGAIAALAKSRAESDPNLLVALVAHSLPDDEATLARWRDALASAAVLLATQAGISANIRRKLRLRAFTVLPPQRSANEGADPKPLRAARGREQFAILAPHGYSRRDFLRDVGLVAYVWTALGYRLRFLALDAPHAELDASLSACRVVYLAEPIEDGGALAARCAALGAILFAPLSYDPARVTFPYTVFPERGATAKKRRSLLLLWLHSSRDYAAFFRETAEKRLILLQDQNCRVQFLRALQYVSPSLVDRPKAGAPLSLWQQIRHRSGPRELAGDAESCVLVCLVRNGREHLPSFLRHYRALGIREFVFIDNGSDDGTLERLEQDPALTVYETSLPHKHYENQIRRLVIEGHCRQRWCLNVDIDELFDYPLSAALGLHGLLRYLRQRGATAMAGHMLDMYDREQRTLDAAELDLRKAYPHYDLSALERAEYHNPELAAYAHENVLQAEIPCFSGGIRQTVFGSKRGTRYLLIKHPLIFLDGQLEPVTHPHYSGHATVADVTCVLYHYKFTPSFKDKALESRASARYVKFAQQQYEQYLGKLTQKGALAIDTPGTQRLTSVDELLAQGFVQVSPEYRRFVAEAASSPPVTALAPEPPLAEAASERRVSAGARRSPALLEGTATALERAR